MKVVLKHKTANLYYAEDTKHGITRSWRKADSQHVEDVLDMQQHLLEIFDLVVIERGRVIQHL